MAHNITLLPGDGIGPEVTAAMRKCVDATGVKINWDVQDVGDFAIAKYNTPLPDHVIESIRKNKIAIKGPITTPVGKGFRSVNVALRQALDLYACVRPAKYYEGTKAVYKDVDIVIFRENTEDLYAGIEFELGKPETLNIIKEINAVQTKKIADDAGVSIKPISVKNTKRITRAAFEYALKHNRKTVTIVHKANIMKFTDGLFLRVALEVAKEYEGRVAVNDCIVDALCMQLVQKPSNFDILVLPNLYGDIVSDLCAGLIGGLGIASGANIGETCSLFEPVHGSAPKYAGQNKVNPTASILSAVLMLEHIGETAAATKLDNALRKVLKENKDVTYDLKKDRNDPTAVGTSQMADAICRAMA